METEYTLMYKGKALGKINLHVAGVHNILNSLAAAAAAFYANVSLRVYKKDSPTSEVRADVLSLSAKKKELQLLTIMLIIPPSFP